MQFDTHEHITTRYLLTALLMAASASPFSAMALPYGVSCFINSSAQSCNADRVSGEIGYSASPTSVHSLKSFEGYLVEVQAEAGAGFVGASSHVRDPANSQATGAARGIMDLRDVTFEAPGRTGSIDVLLNVHLSGDFALTTHNGVFGQSDLYEIAVGTITTRIIVGTRTYRGSYSESYITSGDDGGTLSTSKSGLLADIPDNASIIDRTYQLAATVPVNTPVQVLLDLDASATTGGRSGFNNGVPGESLTDFIHTLSFPDIGPVFTGLPNGVTVNSTDGNIVNNVWGGGSGSPSPVPTPGTTPLLLLGLLGLGLCRRQVALTRGAR